MDSRELMIERQLKARGISSEAVLAAMSKVPREEFVAPELQEHAYEDRPLIFVFGAMRDKAIAEMAEILFPLAQRVIATVAENPRSATPDEIREAAGRTSAEIIDTPDVIVALEKARELAGPGDLVVITGSIYVVGEAMRELGITPAN